MSIIRTYFDKNNTIIDGTKSAINTGRNPVTEVFYGVNVSRFLFYVDLSALRDKIADKTINPSTIVRHTLKMKNTQNWDVLPFRDYRDQIQFSYDHHATSFELELMPIYEFWDEGTGYDFETITNCFDENALVDGASNWKYRTSLNRWGRDGAVASGTTAITVQHFDKGNEDLEMDVTDFVNDLVTGFTGYTGYTGFCLKFTDEFEAEPDDFKRVVAFFTRHTNTFFEPFIETEYDDLIKDDRRNFILNQTNNLFLYVFKQGSLFNLDELPTCTVDGTQFPVTQLTKGVYKAEVLLTAPAYSDGVMYHDVWSNIVIDSLPQADVTMDITPKVSATNYQIGNTSTDPIHYGVSVSGIKKDERVTQGELRKILVHLRKPYTVSTVEVADSVYYRMYVKQGINQVVIVDWTEVNRAFDYNYFAIDSTWLVPQQYFVDIKTVLRDEVHVYNEELRFSVVSVM